MTQAAIMPDWMQARLAGTAEAPGEIEIAPDELPVVTLFLALATQWRWHPVSGARTGIDYAAVPQVAAMIAIAATPALFGDLRVMEAAAIAALAERSGR